MRIEPRFVLARPRNPNNIGAVARAMANFGLRDLRVVDPYEPVWKETKSALDGGAVLQNARAMGLPEALAGSQLVLGTSDGRRKRARPVIPLPGLWDYLGRNLPAGGRVAILFGSEKTGLTNTELQHCRAVLRIPTQDDAPSMNLGQAAALIAAELARPALPQETTGPQSPAPTTEQLEDLVRKMVSALESLGYALRTPKDAKAERIRRMLNGWMLSRRDAAFLQGVFARVARLGL
ncbi:MAG: RNA methyltransferase [Elusimicrobia bacterium]|nr:RNA methyltransferase [Elusimicrobiota bacterium]